MYQKSLRLEKGEWRVKGRGFTWIILLLLMLICGTLLLTDQQLLTPQGLVSHLPRRPVAAAALLLLLYCLKSLTLFFPVLVLQAGAGLLFPPWQALAVNMAGTVLSIGVSYYAGLCWGGGWLERKLQRYPKLKSLTDKQKHHVFGLSLLLRLPGCFPMDVTGAYLGMLRLSFLPCFWGSLLGLVPHVLLGTFLGLTLRQPGSPGFWIGVSLLACFSLISGVTLSWYHKKES